MKDVVKAAGFTVNTLPDRDWLLQGFAYPTKKACFTLTLHLNVHQRPIMKALLFAKVGSFGELLAIEGALLAMLLSSSNGQCVAEEHLCIHKEQPRVRAPRILARRSSSLAASKFLRVAVRLPFLSFGSLPFPSRPT